MDTLLEKAQNRCANHTNAVVRGAWRDVRDRVKRLRDSTSVGSYGPASRGGRDDPSTVQLRKRRALKAVKRLRKKAPSVSRQMDELEEEIRGIPARKGV